MRRPILCGTFTVEQDRDRKPAGTEESALMKVKRMLAGTLSRRGKTFGARLEELGVRSQDDVVPSVVRRLCVFIEAHGLQSEGLFRLSGNQKVVERLRASFDRVGDADLEGSGDVAAAAALLKLFLRELPEPAIPDHLAMELLAAHEKFADEPREYVATMRRLTSQMPEPNRQLVRYLAGFLHRVAKHEPHNRMGPNSLGIIFGPNLCRVNSGYRGLHQQTLTNQLVARLIADYNAIFENIDADIQPRRVADHTIQAAVAEHLFGEIQSDALPPATAEVIQRKRKERHESTSQSQERKVIRSNSEERPLEEGMVSSKDNMRRVSSHEDMTTKAKNSTFLQEIHDPALGHGIRCNNRPLHEHNPPSRPPSSLGSSSEELSFLTDVDDEHERRRSSERFASFPHPGATRGRRSQGRRRRTHHSNRNEDQDESGSSKENEDSDQASSRSHHQHHHHHHHHSENPSVLVHSSSFGSSTSDDDSSQEVDPKSHSFLQLHPQVEREDRSPSPSPSTPRKFFMPPLDLTTLHQQVDCNEPLTSQGNWGYTHRVHEEGHVMLSPRNSMILTRRTYLDPNVPPSPPLEHDVQHLKRIGTEPVNTSRIKHITKQINSLKRKIKHYEEDFEKQFGYRPSHSDKMGCREIKKMTSELSKLRKELKQIKEDPQGPCAAVQQDRIVPTPATHSSKTSVSLEDTLTDIEQRLNEKRIVADRPENLEDLSREQLLDEKVSVQKCLLLLESIHGRPTSREDRDLVRPLYDRYRALKRLVVRSGSSKLKDSVTELATIHEHEAMDFTQASPQHQATATEDSTGASETEQESVDLVPLLKTSSGDVDLLDLKRQRKGAEIGENLHALPMPELLKQQRETREEKKHLRRSLREFEEEFQRATGKKAQKEDRVQVEGIYIQYKQAKAKLRLLEALLAKHGTIGNCGGV